MSSDFVGLSSAVLRKAVSSVKRSASGRTWPIVAAVGLALIASAALWFGIVLLIRAFV
jgi:disulfide bond formation protein DsbB